MSIRCPKAELLAFPVRTRRVDNLLVALADLPGLKKEEIRVELTDSVLVIEAAPKREDEAFFRRAGRRRIALPEDARIQLAKAELKLQQLDDSQTVRKSESPVPHDEYAAI